MEEYKLKPNKKLFTKVQAIGEKVKLFKNITRKKTVTDRDNLNKHIKEINKTINELIK